MCARFRYTNHKGAGEDLVPVATEIAAEIRQEQRARERFPETPWLLLGERANRGRLRESFDGCRW